MWSREISHNYEQISGKLRIHCPEIRMDLSSRVSEGMNAVANVSSQLL